MDNPKKLGRPNVGTKIGIRLKHHQRLKAQRVGDGNINLGVRRCIDSFKGDYKPCDTEPNLPTGTL